MQIHVGECCSFPRQEGGQKLEPHVLLIPIAIGAPLNHANLVIQALDEVELDVVRYVWVTVQAWARAWAATAR